MELFYAVEKGELDKVREFLETGGDVEERDSYGWTLLMSASVYGHFEIVKYLLEHGADVHAISPKRDGSRTALMLASQIGYFEIAKLLLQYHADVNAEDSEGWTSFIYAFAANHSNLLKIGKLLIKHGTKINKKSEDNWSALRFSSDRTHIPSVLLLIQYADCFEKEEKEKLRSLKFKADFRKYTA